MKHARPVFPLLSAVLLSGVLVLTASAAFGPIIRVSQPQPDPSQTAESSAPDISADGRYTVYHSSSPNLVTGDAGGKIDIFLYDRILGTNQKIYLPTGGGEAGGDSAYPKISADGRWVAFLSEATNLLAEGNDPSSDPDIYLLDRDTDTDGVFDESGGTALEMIDISDPGELEGIPPTFFSMSADGQQFAYNQYRTVEPPGGILISDIFLYDRRGPSLVQINGMDADGSSTQPILSPSGRYVAFSSEATNLVPGDANADKDVFLYDKVSGKTTRISVSNTGLEGDNNSGIDVFSNFSADEHWFWFYSDAENLVSNDENLERDTFFYNIQESSLYRVQELIGENQQDHLYVGAGMLTGGRWLIYSDSYQNSSPFYAFHTITRQRLLINERPDGQVAGGTVNASAFSKDGGWVAFESDAEDLVSGVDHPGADIFLRELGLDQSREVYLPVLFGQ